MAASPYASTEETTNANRANRLILGPCTDQLRDILRHFVPPATFPNVIKKWHAIFPRLTKEQRSLILPQNNSYTGNYDDIGIGLLYILLRIICNIPPHSNGWGNYPHPTDRSLSANIERIRIARNQFVHTDFPKISTGDFNKIWTAVRSAVVDLDSFLNNGQHYEKEVDFLRYAKMDHNPEPRHEEVAAMRKRVHDSLEGVNTDETGYKMVKIEGKGPEENELLRNLKKYVESGKTTKIRHARGVLIGCAGAGKTSLLRRLQGKDLENVESTVGLDVHHQIFDITDGTLRVTSDTGNKNLISYTMPKESTKSNIISKGVNTEKLIRQEQDELAQVKAEEFVNDQKNVENNNEENNLIVRKFEDEELLEIVAKVENEATVSVTDFAGQFSYYASHQIYIRPRFFFILVVSLTQNFEDIVDEKENSDEDTSENDNLSSKKNFISKWNYRDYLEFWINSIKTFGSTESKVCVVFTHADQVSEKEARDFRRCFWDTLLKEEWFHKCVGEREFTLSLQPGASSNNPRDSSTGNLMKESDESLKKLSEAITEIANDAIINTKESEVPVSWAVLEYILKKHYGELFLLTIEDLKKINKSLDIFQLSGKQEIEEYLSLFHHNGFLLHLKGDNLENHVILDIQLFAKAFSKLIADEKHLNGCVDRCYVLWKQYNESGHLCNRLIENLWKGTQFLEHKETLFSYMEKLNMLVKIDEDESRGEESYYIPCMNKTPFVPQKDQEEKIEKSSILCFRFSSFTLFIFYRLVAYCMKSLKWKIRENKDGKKGLYETAAIFEKDYHTILVGVQKDQIQLQVMCLREIGIKKNVSSRIGNKLEEALESLGKTFTKDRMDFERGYKCLNVLCDETDKEFTEAQVSKRANEYIQCVPCDKKHMINVSYWEQVDDEEDLPKEWPNPSIFDPLDVKKCKRDFDESLRLWCYKMDRNPRGKVLVINNEIFDIHWDGERKDRDGTMEDEKKIREVFEQMNFKVKVFQNKKGEEIKDILKQEVKKKFHRTADCFVLVIMTHGGNGAICGTDWKTVSIEEIKNQLNGENFPAMADKPKVILIQACRGGGQDEGVKKTSDTTKAIKEAEERLRDLTLNSQTDSLSGACIPKMSHMVVAMGTTQGMMSYRNTLYGSWFLQAFAFVLAKYAYKDDIYGILTKVNILVSRGRAVDRESGKTYVTISEFSSTLLRWLYFRPGLIKKVKKNTRN